MLRKWRHRGSYTLDNSLCDPAKPMKEARALGWARSRKTAARAKKTAPGVVVSSRAPARPLFLVALLDTELLGEVAAHLSLADVVNLASACRELRAYVASRRWMWARLAVCWRVPVAPSKASARTVGAVLSLHDIQVVRVWRIKDTAEAVRGRPHSKAAIGISVDGIFINRKTRKARRLRATPQPQGQLPRPVRFGVFESFVRVRGWVLHNNEEVLEIIAPVVGANRKIIKKER